MKKDKLLRLEKRNKKAPIRSFAVPHSSFCSKILPYQVYFTTLTPKIQIFLGGRIMVIHNLKNGKYSIKIKGLDEKIVTSSWADAMKIAWKLGGNK